MDFPICFLSNSSSTHLGTTAIFLDASLTMPLPHPKFTSCSNHGSCIKNKNAFYVQAPADCPMWNLSNKLHFYQNGWSFFLFPKKVQTPGKPSLVSPCHSYISFPTQKVCSTCGLQWYPVHISTSELLFSPLEPTQDLVQDRGLVNVGGIKQGCPQGNIFPYWNPCYTLYKVNITWDFY